MNEFNPRKWLNQTPMLTDYNENLYIGYLYNKYCLRLYYKTYLVLCDDVIQNLSVWRAINLVKLVKET